jgi:hypothetical protein
MAEVRRLRGGRGSAPKVSIRNLGYSPTVEACSAPTGGTEARSHRRSTYLQ